MTAGNPNHQHNGERVVAWHFLTDKGHHYMVDADGKAVMFNGTKRSITSSIRSAIAPAILSSAAER